MFYGPSGAGTADTQPRRQEKADDKSQHGKGLDDVELLSRHDLIAQIQTDLVAYDSSIPAQLFASCILLYCCARVQAEPVPAATGAAPMRFMPCSQVQQAMTLQRLLSSQSMDRQSLTMHQAAFQTTRNQHMHRPAEALPSHSDALGANEQQKASYLAYDVAMLLL